LGNTTTGTNIVSGTLTNTSNGIAIGTVVNGYYLTVSGNYVYTATSTVSNQLFTLGAISNNASTLPGVVNTTNFYVIEV
jgi:hypothetical protein